MQKTGVSRAQIYRIKEEPLVAKSMPRCRKVIGGVPRKFTPYDGRRIAREVYRLWQTFHSWTAKQLIEENGIIGVLLRTVQRVLNNCGFFYLHTLKNVLMTSAERGKSVKFAKQIVRNYDESLWTRHVAFYFDGVSFIYKRNPKVYALAPRGRVWRRKGEGLYRDASAKVKRRVQVEKY